MRRERGELLFQIAKKRAGERDIQEQRLRAAKHRNEPQKLANLEKASYTYVERFWGGMRGIKAQNCKGG